MRHLKIPATQARRIEIGMALLAGLMTGAAIDGWVEVKR